MILNLKFMASAWIDPPATACNLELAETPWVSEIWTSSVFRQQVSVRLRLNCLQSKLSTKLAHFRFKIYNTSKMAKQPRLALLGLDDTILCLDFGQFLLNL